MEDVKNNETLKRINALLNSFNNTFEVEANLVKEEDEVIADGVKIKSLKDDGIDFVSSVHDTFNTIVQSISDEHEVIYDDGKGLAIARKIVKTDYVIEEF